MRIQTSIMKNQAKTLHPSKANGYLSFYTFYWVISCLQMFQEALQLQSIRMQSFVVELVDDFFEFFEGDGFVGGGLVVDVGTVEQLQKFVIIDSVLNPFCDGFELLVVNNSVLIGVEDTKNPLKALLGLGLSHPGSYNIQVFFESNGFVLLLECVDEVEDEGIPLVEPQLFKSFVDFNGINGATSVFVKDVESFSELVVILFSQSFLPACGFWGGWGRGLHLGSAHWIDFKQQKLKARFFYNPIHLQNQGLTLQNAKNDHLLSKKSQSVARSAFGARIFVCQIIQENLLFENDDDWSLFLSQLNLFVAKGVRYVCKLGQRK